MTQQQQPIRTISIHGKDYVDVAERVRLCNADEGFTFVAQERYQIGERWFFCTKIEVKGHTYYGDAEIKFGARSGPDSTNPLECAQTSALGRALGFAGYGAVESIASADEIVRAQHASAQNATPKKTSPTKNNSLNQSIVTVKKRAIQLGAAKDAETWSAILDYCGIQHIENEEDIQTLTLYLDDVEQKQQIQQAASDAIATPSE
jgi:hypothetical protein